MATIPSDYVNYKSTPIFTPENIPKMFLHRHNTRVGVYGKICVLQGQLKFYGFRDRRGEVEQEIIINAGDIAISPPQYWHKVEFLTEETQFQVRFYAQNNSQIVRENLNERSSEL
ncbi:DUF1971 domain-containing protein [Photobacterium kishitanii]|uniref:DUF1971 domain-containing protein n=1 Tax=Photobacterium kishitanii TaxID=318456 RepID=A0AAX0YV01_9GAMM|nr:DUF1971 domain-containing protein [Photobacterium kishitanii]KJG55948.1 cytoplasmic protein [Photobacterium kishitanii]KJG59172.1 cytoplasmic protein [Photobacterium kishitanii]KJG64154.1 cytoplasmic protein [Photobacterium kishitanii]KJG68252.1 cytoplasmic protein [Photobacterium kishitanii]OBU27583.1 cytoplasmic protein [Photobacterium kishitanii]